MITKYSRTKHKYKINWHVVGAMVLSLVCWVIIILLLINAMGCSTMKQSAEFTDPNGFGVKLVNSKSSFCYWSKYKAQVDTFGMSTIVYDAEGHPDPNSVKAVAEGVTDAFLKGAGL